MENVYFSQQNISLNYERSEETVRCKESIEYLYYRDDKSLRIWEKTRCPKIARHSGNTEIESKMSLGIRDYANHFLMKM